jgi:hypothetical protein
MMLVSVGTGCTVTPQPGLRNLGRNMLENASSIPTSLMQRIANENDIKCRTIGRCVHGGIIDRELGTLCKPLQEHPEDLGRRFLYARYDPDLSKLSLEMLGLGHLSNPSFEMDDVSPRQIKVLTEVGQKYAEQVDILRHFPPFVPTPQRQAA